MSCNCGSDTFKNNINVSTFCQDCMPDELSWLVPVTEKPDPFLMDRVHAYITPDNVVYVLSHDRTRAIELAGGKVDIDLSPYALKSDLVEYIAGQGIIIKNGVISSNVDFKPVLLRVETLETDVNNLKIKMTNVEQELAEVRDIATRALNKPDNDTKYSAGNGLSLTDTTFSVKGSNDFRFNSDGSLDMNPSWLATTLTTNNLNLIKVTQVGENTFLDLAGIKKYIDDGDTDTFARTQYVVANNLYIPASSDSFGYTFNLTSNPRTAKFTNATLVINLPSLDVEGIRLEGDRAVSSGVSSYSTSSEDKFTFQIPLYEDNTSRRIFCETIRFPWKDLELTISGFVSMGSASMNIRNFEAYITTGKLINKVEHKYINLINNAPSYTREVDGFRYRLTLTSIPKIEVWGLNIIK